MALKNFFKWAVISLICILSWALNVQSIQFVNGLYNDIIIGIDGDMVDETECLNIRRELELILVEFSKSLQEATYNRAGIGRVDILIPLDWHLSYCGLENALPASTLHSYENSHFKITTNHPLSKEWPWTKQYKPCGQEGSFIIFPLPFISPSKLSSSIKGRIMMSEWAKFRYGVFDEVGYATSQTPFPACYTKEKLAYFTTCSNATLPAITLNPTACSMEFLMKQSPNIIEHLKQGPTSIMSAPYIDESATAHFCNETTHDPWTDTKQNIYCERQSVSTIVSKHHDFQNLQKDKIHFQSTVPEIRFLKHDREYPAAFAFLIEDSTEMRSTNKLLHVKQAMAQFLEILDPLTEVQIIIFSGENNIRSKSNQLATDQIKMELLNFIPDLKGDPVPVNGPIQLTPVVNYTLDAPRIYSWNFFLLSSSSKNITDMNLAIQEFRKTNHSISIITFDNDLITNSNEWLKWYGISNSKNVIALPYCSAGQCSLRTSSLIVQHMTSCLKDQQFGPRFIQKSAAIELGNIQGYSKAFVLRGNPIEVKNFYLLMSIPVTVPTPIAFITLTSPDGENQCTPEPLLEYGYVLKFAGSSCAFQNGEWTIKLVSNIHPGNNLYFDVLLELISDPEIEELNVITSLGVLDLTKELNPTSHPTPLYISVSSKQGYPVLDAEVSIVCHHSGLVGGILSGKEIIAKDDGDNDNGADQTSNDGVYSGYLSGYSTNSAPYHLCEVLVTGQKILTKIESPQATFLHENMTDKCCGKSITPVEFKNLLHPLTYHTFLPGFKTSEPWSNARLQPGQVGPISISENSDTSVSIQFTGVWGDVSDRTVSVSHFQACCTPQISTAPPSVPSENDCKEDTTEISGTVLPPSTQTVTMSKEVLVNAFIPSENDWANVDYLKCRIRAVNTNSEFGSLSSGIIEVDVRPITKGTGNNSVTKCESLSDDCLPILIFWILIGCVALLLVLLLVTISICCCCACKKQKKEPQQVYRQDTIQRTPRLDNDVVVSYTKETSNNNNTPYNANVPGKTEEPKVIKELFVNHAYIQDGDGEVKIIADSGEILRKPLNNENPTPIERPPQNIPSPFRRNIQTRAPPREQAFTELPAQSMQIFKPEPYPRPNSTSIPKQRQRQLNQRPEIIHPNPMLRSDTIEDNQQHEPAMMVPTISTVRQDPQVIYASVSRAGRLRPPSNFEDIHLTAPRRSGLDPHYMVPHNSLPRMVQNARAPIPNFRQSPPQVQPFPSSDNDSSMPTPVRKPPRFNKPPSYPTGSQIVSNRPQINQSTFLRERTDTPSTLIRPTSGIAVQPPVPPRRFDRSVNTGNDLGPTNIPVHRFTRNPIPSDEDSDQWDDGENFGDSYA